MNFSELPLADQEPSEQEREKLQALLRQLDKYLNTPGDWGYGTQLGNLSSTVKTVLHRLNQ